MEQVSAAPAPGVLARTLGLRPGEGPALALAFACFFSLLSGYYVLRSVRDAMIAADGTRLIPTVFTSVFVCMLLLTPVYGAVVSRLPRRVFLPLVFTRGDRDAGGLRDRLPRSAAFGLGADRHSRSSSR